MRFSPARAGPLLARPALLGVGSGIVGAATLFAKTGGTSLAPLFPTAPGGLGSVALPFLSLLALVGPTGLTFPCWAHDLPSPGARLWGWVSARLAR
jgi:hypothetical protein